MNAKACPRTSSGVFVRTGATFTLKKLIGIVLAIVGAVIFIPPIIGFNIVYS
ncbi:MAG: hypothetical protein ACE5SW_07220 [Nitrososphaeraceae archaeon]